MHSKWLLRLVLAAVAVFSLALIACDDDDENGDQTPAVGDQTPDQTPTDGDGDLGTVTVMGVWGDEELESFRAMVQGWGGRMDFTGTRDLTAILTTRVEGGNPPDVAIPPEIGLFQQFAREGELVPLSECPGLEDQIRQNYPQSFIDLGTVDGTLYGFFMKADTKGTIWYNPQFFQENGYEPLTADSTFEDLIALSDQIANDGQVPPWSIGQSTGGGGDGFPGSDTIQQIVLNQIDADFYDAIIDGTAEFTDERMQQAWEMYGQIALTEGYTTPNSAEGMIATNFQDSVFPPFQDPPEAAMVHMGAFAGGFITEQFPDAEAGQDFDFMPWPGGDVTGGANVAYAFNSDPTTCSFLEHIASAEAQQIWVQRGGFTSVNEQVDLEQYPDPVAQNAAQQLLEAETFRFDLDDAIGGAVQQAEFQGILNYLQNPGNLQSILQNIEAAREDEDIPAGEDTPTDEGTPADDGADGG